MRYRLIDAGGEVLDEGDGDATVDNGTLFVPQAALSVAPAAIAELAETEQPYGLRLRLTDGVTLELTMLGRMRGQIFADLADARTSELTRGSGIGRPEIFPGEIDGVRGELHVFEDCLVTVPAAGEAERIPFSFIDAATEPDAAIAAGYRITIAVPGRAELTASALGRQTTEFAGLLRERRLQATKRTSAFLGALLPELGPVALRWLAGILRDGRAASPAELDGVDPAVRPALLAAVTHPECAADLTGAWIGFTQVNSVRRAAVGVEPWHDSAPTPRIMIMAETTTASARWPARRSCPRVSPARSPRWVRPSPTACSVTVRRPALVP